MLGISPAKSLLILLGGVENFTHSVDELVMVIEGKLEIEMEGLIFCLEIGEEVFIPAKVNHSVRNIGDFISKRLYGYRNIIEDKK